MANPKEIRTWADVPEDTSDYKTWADVPEDTSDSKTRTDVPKSSYDKSKYTPVHFGHTNTDTLKRLDDNAIYMRPENDPSIKQEGWYYRNDDTGKFNPAPSVSPSEQNIPWYKKAMAAALLPLGPVGIGLGSAASSDIKKTYAGAGLGIGRGFKSLAKLSTELPGSETMQKIVGLTPEEIKQSREDLKRGNELISDKYQQITGYKPGQVPVSEFIGEQVPGAMLTAGIGAGAGVTSKLGKMALMAGEGALQNAIAPSESDELTGREYWKSKGKEAAIGAGLGLGLNALLGSGKYFKKIAGEFKPAEALERAARLRNIPTGQLESEVVSGAINTDIKRLARESIIQDLETARINPGLRDAAKAELNSIPFDSPTYSDDIKKIINKYNITEFRDTSKKILSGELDNVFKSSLGEDYKSGLRQARNLYESKQIDLQHQLDMLEGGPSNIQPFGFKNKKALEAELQDVNDMLNNLDSLGEMVKSSEAAERFLPTLKTSLTSISENKPLASIVEMNNKSIGAPVEPTLKQIMNPKGGKSVIADVLSQVAGEPTEIFEKQQEGLKKGIANLVDNYRLQGNKNTSEFFYDAIDTNVDNIKQYFKNRYKMIEELGSINSPVSSADIFKVNKVLNQAMEESESAALKVTIRKLQRESDAIKTLSGLDTFRQTVGNMGEQVKREGGHYLKQDTLAKLYETLDDLYKKGLDRSSRHIPEETKKILMGDMTLSELFQATKSAYKDEVFGSINKQTKQLRDLIPTQIPEEALDAKINQWIKSGSKLNQDIKVMSNDAKIALKKRMFEQIQDFIHPDTGDFNLPSAANRLEKYETLLNNRDLFSKAEQESINKLKLGYRDLAESYTFKAIPNNGARAAIVHLMTFALTSKIGLIGLVSKPVLKELLGNPKTRDMLLKSLEKVAASPELSKTTREVLLRANITLNNSINEPDVK